MMSVAITEEIPEHVDIGIITIRLEDELPAVKRVFNINRDTNPIKVGDREYWFANVKSKDSNLVIAITVACEQGNEMSKEVTGDLISSFNPMLIMLVGIAAGVKDKVELGDVVVSESVLYYEPKKVMPGGENEPNWSIENAPTSLPTEVEKFFSHPNVLSYWRNAFHTAEVKLKSEGLPNPPDVLHPTLHKRIIASGEKILADGSLKRMQKKTHKRIWAGETEGWGFARAAKKTRKEWIVVRGVSDFGDMETHEGKRKDEYHHSAANAAATCSRTIIECVYAPPKKEAVASEERNKSLQEKSKNNPWTLFGRPIKLSSLSQEDFWINVADDNTKTLKLRIILPSGKFEGAPGQLPLVSDGMFLPDVIASIADMIKESDVRLDVQSLFDIDVVCKKGDQFELREDILSECNLIFVATGDVNLATRLLFQHESLLNIKPGTCHPKSPDICGVTKDYHTPSNPDLGLLSVFRSPFNDERIVILACGPNAIGTLGALKLLHLYITGEARRHGNNRYEETVAAKIINFQRIRYRFPLIGSTNPPMELQNIDVDELIHGTGVME